MWLIAKELKNKKNTPAWKKLGFFNDWLKTIMELVDEGDNKKPIEPTIAYLAKTNAYLTRKLNELEANTTPAPQPQACDPSMKATPMLTSSCPAWASVAAKSPQPPTSKTTKAPQTATSQDPSADPQCLIIQVQPPILVKERPNGIEVRKKTNNMLEKKDVPQFFHVMAVGYLGAGNIKIMMNHSSKASDFMKYRKDVAEIIMKNKVLSILPDTEHYWVKITKVPTWCGNDDPVTIDLIHEELCTYLLEYKEMKQWCIP